MNKLSVAIPQELAVISFDESDVADLFYAPVTHIKQPLDAMGQAATKVLLESITQKGIITAMNMEASLVVRTSSLFSLTSPKAVVR